MGGSASTSSPSPAPSGGAPAKKEEFGILNFLVEDEEKRKELRAKAEAMSEAAGSMKPLQTAAPAPINVNGGLLQQPAIIPMSPAGSGVYGMDPTKMEGGLDKFMKLVGTFF